MRDRIDRHAAVTGLRIAEAKLPRRRSVDRARRPGPDAASRSGQGGRPRRARAAAGPAAGSTPPSARAGSHATRGLERDGRGGRGPRHARRTSADDQRAVARAGAVRPGDGAGELAGAERAEDGQRARGRARSRRGCRAAARRSRAGSRPRAAGRGRAAAAAAAGGAGSRSRAHPPQHQQRDQRDAPERHGTDSSMPSGSAVPANATKPARPIAPTSRSAPTLISASPRPEAGAGEPPEPPHVGADVAGGEQAEQLGLGVRPQVPAPAEVGVGQRAPAQRAEEVLADDPGQQAGAAPATG